MTRQRGVALLTALLVLALVTIAVASLTERFHLDLRRVSNQQQREQGFQYATGLEALARTVLQADERDSARIDHHGDVWAQPLPLLPVSGGLLSATMVDLDGRFNLNNLVIDDVPQQRQLAVFRRLLRLLELDPTRADAVLDWLDSDALPSPGGAEDSYYARLDPGYRAANQGFHHPSELRLVAGFDDQAWARLRPYVTALPTPDRPTRINLNTTSEMLLRALDPAITEQVAQILYQDGAAEWTRVGPFIDHPLLVGRLQPGTAGLVGVDSQYFLLRSQVQLGGRQQDFYSVIEQAGGWRVTWRSRSPY